MKNFSEIICEKFITLFDTKEKDIETKRKYAKEVYDMVVKSYEYIGGLAGCKSYDDFVKQYVDPTDGDSLIWKMIRRTDHISAIKIYSTKRGGRKGIVMATDGTEQGKKDASKILDEDYKLKERQAWNEVSGKALGSALNSGALPIPNYCVPELMKDKNKNEFRMRDDGYFYDRIIKGDWHTKLCVGNPPNEFKGDKIDKEMIAKLKELGKKYEAEKK